MPGLKLKAEDAEDLRAIAAVTQDAIAPLHDLAFLPDERRFVIALNRFCWESDADTADGVFERTNCGLCFEHVTRAETRGFEGKRRDDMLVLLTMTEAGGKVTLSFAGGHDLRLTVDRLECRMDDFGEPWPTKTRPHHQSHEAWQEWQAQGPAA
jgi:hypothetical protein